MVKKKTSTLSESEFPDRICQGDIIRNVDYIESADEKDGIITISKIEFPYVMVLTQECDLGNARIKKDDRFNNVLISILVAPIYNLDHVKEGSHLDLLDVKVSDIRKRTTIDSICDNEVSRYHYLSIEAEHEMPPSVIDFKHYFSVDVRYLEEKKKGGDFLCQVSPLFRERISQRFAEYLSRIGLPDFIEVSLTPSTPQD